MTLFDYKDAVTSESRTEVSGWGWQSWAGQAASGERGAQRPLPRTKFYKSVQSKCAQYHHSWGCPLQPLWREVSECMHRDTLFAFHLPIKPITQQEDVDWMLPFFSLFPEDFWLVSCSCQLLLSWLAQLHLLLVHRTALKSSHKTGFSDDVWISV